MNICNIEGCDREADHGRKGMCGKHYKQLYRHGRLTPESERMCQSYMDGDICLVDGCNKKPCGKGYCSKHYQQLKLHGEIKQRTLSDPNEIIKHSAYAEIVLYNKSCEEVDRAIIDIDDVESVSNNKWTLYKNGYPGARINGKLIYLHNFIIRDVRKPYEIDHINRNRLDNRKENLRICTRQQNNCNKNIPSNNTSGVCGVYWDNTGKRWVARISKNKKTIFQKYFKNFEDAVIARKEAEKEYWGEYAPRG